MRTLASTRQPTTTGLPRPRIRLNAFGAGFGLSGLAGTWSAAASQLGGPRWVAETVWAVAAAAWLGVLVAYLVRSGGPSRVVADLRDPVLAPFAALVPITASLLGAHLYTLAPAAGRAVVLVAVTLTLGFGAWFTAQLFVEPRELASLHGGHLLPTVAGSFLSGQTLAAIGHHTLGAALVWAGVMFWLLLGGVLLMRFLTVPRLPDALLPTLAIYSAPPAVAGNAWWVVAGAPQALTLDAAAVHLALAGALVLLLAPHLALLGRYARLPFTTGFWAFTFTAASSATYAVHLLAVHGGDSARPGAWTVVAWAAVAVATAFIGAIAVRSLVGVLRPVRRGTARR
jgi:tellurite resistance protein